MKLRSLVLADAANATADGRSNAIGIGTRVVITPSLPVQGQLALLVAVDLDDDDQTQHAVELRMAEPDGTMNTLATGNAGVNGPKRYADLPASIQLAIPIRPTFRIRGLHRLDFQFGPISESIDLVVEVLQAPAMEPSGATHESRAPSRPPAVTSAGATRPG
jgi:Family of unknown function (DUF6941)